jgi:hypothetical protein
MSEALKEVDAQARKTANGSLTDYVAQLRKAAREARNAGTDIDRDLGGGIEDMARRANKPLRDVSKAISSLAEGGSRRMADLKTNVVLNMRLIGRSLGRDTDEGKKAFADNFRAAARPSSSSMDAGSVSTQQGTAQINRYLRQALAVYGITGRQATHYIQSPIGDLQGKPTPSTLGNAGGQPGKAGGGWIGSQGMRGQDTVPVMLGAGEAVLNRHQQGVVRACLVRGSLTGCFRRSGRRITWRAAGMSSSRG